MTSNAHSSIGASSCERWWNCPGSVALSATAPEVPSSPHAKEGHEAHSMAEMFLRFPEQIEAFGQSEMAEACLLYAETVWQEMKSQSALPSDLLVEHHISVPSVHKDAYGTCDAMFWVPFGKLVVIDFKYGAGVPVEVKDNKQLLYYALGALESLSEEDRNEISGVRAIVVQPRAPHADGPVRTCEYTLPEMAQFRAGLQAAVNRLKDPSAPLVTGSWCRWCRAAAICPQLAKEAQAAAAIEFKDAALVQYERPSPISYSPDQLAQLLDIFPRVKEWMESVTAHAEGMLHRGDAIPGYTLVAKRSVREWIDPDAAEEKLKAAVGDACFTEPKLKSPAQIEKLLGRSKKKELEGLVRYSSPGLKMARGAHTGSALSEEEGSEFAHLFPSS
jgi:uncharacterized protein YbdZ (MbtH family)